MGYSQSTPFTATQNQRPDVPVDADQSVPGRRAAAGGQLARAEHVPRPEPRPRSRRSTSRTRSFALPWSTCSASCRDSGCSKSATPAATGTTLTTDAELNACRRSTSPRAGVRDQATIDFLGTQVPNPFVGLLPTGFTGANVARSQLLRPFPQFNNVPTNATRRHEPVRLGAVQAREALQPRATRSSAPTRGRTSPSASSS